MNGLLDRINRVINTDAFTKSLEKDGLILADFQGSWVDYDTFDSLPETHKRAILAGEEELGRTGVVTL